MDSISSVPVIVNDTIEYILKSDVTAFYADMMDKQATQFTIIVSVIGGVFAIAIGATWWWNYKGAKQQISDEISTARQALNRVFRNHQKEVDKSVTMYINEFNGFKGSLQKSVNTQIDSKIKETLAAEIEKLNKHMDDIDKHSMQEIEALKAKTIDDFTHQKAEISRIFALYCKSVSPIHSVSWWIDALKNYSITKNEKWVGVACENIVEILKDIDISKVNKKYSETVKEDIDTVNKYIPQTRQSDKQMIVKKLKEIQKAVVQDE